MRIKFRKTLSFLLCTALLLPVISDIFCVYASGTSIMKESEDFSFNGHSYTIFSGAISSWEEAELFCENKGGYLAVISSQEENDALYQFMCDAGYSSAYFGYSDATNEGTWRWVDGSSVSYINWHPGEPNSENSNEDYAMFYYKFTDGTWNDGDFMQGTVNDPGAFICEWGGWNPHGSYQGPNYGKGSTAFIRKPSHWASPIYCYVYDKGTDYNGPGTGVENAPWPGKLMEVTNVPDLYSYRIPDYFNRPMVMFCSADGMQYPPTLEPGMEITAVGDWMFENNQWYLWDSGGRFGNKTSCDDEIIEKVRKYTSSETVAQYLAIMNANYSPDECLRRLADFFGNMGITDPREGISYLTSASPYRKAYLQLTDDMAYGANNYWLWLKEHPARRAMLFADGLIYNYELMAYLNPATYIDNDLPGVKKCKELLKDFLALNGDSHIVGNTVSDSIENTNKIEQYLSNTLKLNGIYQDHAADSLINQILGCTDPVKREKLQLKFANKIVNSPYLMQNVEGKKVLRVASDYIGEALEYAGPFIEIIGATAQDIVDLINMNRQIDIYKNNKKFLLTIYNSREISTDMRLAAWYLLDDIENGYWNKFVSALGHIFTFETGLIESKLVLDKSIFETAAAGMGAESIGTFLVNAVGTLTLATFLTNIVVDIGDFVEQVAKTQGYAELGHLYAKILESDKEKFLAAPTAKNAWQFFEDYTILWNLRYAGEEQFLKMDTIKVLFVLKGYPDNYYHTEKEKLVKDNLRMLNNIKFNMEAQDNIPNSVQYLKKAVINCPVNVSVYTKTGTLVAKLIDGVPSDITNSYGRFAVVEQSYTGEYAKVICLLTDEELEYRLEATNNGLVDYVSFDGEKYETFDRVEVQKGNVIDVKEEEYELKVDKNAEEGTIGSFVTKTPDSIIQAQEIIADAPHIDLFDCQKKAVGVTVLPLDASNSGVRWSSEDEEIARVNSGVIEGISEGTTTIYAISLEDENIYVPIEVTVSNHTHDFADGICLVCGMEQHKTVSDIRFAAHSLSLLGNIAVNYYVYIPEELVEDEGAYIEFTMPDGTIEQAFVKNAAKQVIEDTICRHFTCEIPSSQMTGKIAARLVLSDGTASEVDIYSAQIYAGKVLANISGNSAFSKASSMVKRMLSYGGYAQDYFQYDDSPLAYEILTDEEKDLSSVTPDLLSEYTYTLHGEEDGLHYYGTSLILKSETTIRHYFTIDEGHDIEEYSFCLGNKLLKPEENGMYYYVDIPNIPSAELDTMYTVSVGDFSITYSALSYVLSKLNKEDTEASLTNVLKAMYLYNQEANAYFGA